MRRASGALFIALGAACALVAAGCGRPVKIDAAQAREPASRADGQHSSKQLSWVKDDLGHVVMLPAAPRRVVSLSPNLTEVVFFLGAGDRLVGRTDFCDYPPEAIAVPSVGAIVMPSLEKVLALKPDLVLAAHGNDMSFIQRLRERKVPLFGVNPQNLEDVFSVMERLVLILGLGDAGRERIEQLRREVTALRAEAATLNTRPSALVVVEMDPLFVAGSGSFVDDLLREARLTNAAVGEKPWAQWSGERLLASRADLLIFAHGHVGQREGRNELLAAVRKRSPWRELPAVKAGHVYTVQDDYITIPGPRLVKGLAALVEIHKTYSRAASIARREAQNAADP